MVGYPFAARGDPRRRGSRRVRVRRCRGVGALCGAPRLDRPGRGRSSPRRRRGSPQVQGQARPRCEAQAAGQEKGRQEEVPAVKQPLPLLLLGAALACARAPQPAAVTPADVPALTSQAQQQPQNPTIQFRLGAALAAAGRCDTASVVARAGLALEPDNVLGPLVLGACRERADRYDEAVAIYGDFAAQHPNARGVAALRGEAELALAPPEPATVAVLPLVIAGDSGVQPLSRGLAELIATDLAYIRTLRLLE